MSRHAAQHASQHASQHVSQTVAASAAPVPHRNGSAAVVSAAAPPSNAAIANLPFAFTASDSWVSTTISPSGASSNDEPSLEQKIMTTMYGQVYDALAFNGGGGTPMMDTRVEYFQMSSRGQPVNAACFDKLATVDQTGKIDMRQLEAFAMLVNKNSYMERMDVNYGAIVNSAGSTVHADKEEARQKQLELIDKYLHVTTTQTNPFNPDEKLTTLQDTPIYAKYKQTKVAFELAQMNYRLFVNSCDMTTPAGQAYYQAVEPSKKGAVELAQTEWRNSAAFVESALSTLASSGQSLAAYVIADARAVYKNTSLGAISLSDNWHPCYPYPSNWAAKDASWMEISTSTSKLNNTYTTESTKWGGGGSWGWGLFSIGGGVSSSEKNTHSHSQATNISIKMNMSIVQISRPWMRDMLFSIGDWSLESNKAGAISSGNMDDVTSKLLPAYPTAFVVVKDVEITGDWSEEDKTTMEKSLKTEGSAGWGPFAIKANYEKQDTKDTFQSTMDKNTLKIPGMQIIGWIQRIVPLAPKIDG